MQKSLNTPLQYNNTNREVNKYWAAYEAAIKNRNTKDANKIVSSTIEYLYQAHLKLDTSDKQHIAAQNQPHQICDIRRDTEQLQDLLFVIRAYNKTSSSENLQYKAFQHMTQKIMTKGQTYQLERQNRQIIN